MHIHQLSVTFQPEQDRLLARIATTAGEEMRLWLTRRLVRGVWPLLERLLDEQLMRDDAALAGQDAAAPGARQAYADLRRQAFLQQADFDTPFKEAPSRPLGDEPLLVTHVDVTPLAGGRVRLGFAEQAADGSAARGFEMEVEPVLLQGFLHLVGQAVAQAQWQEPWPGGPAAPAQAEDEPLRPRYLN